MNKWFFAYGGGFLNFHINSPQIGGHFLALAPFTPTLGQWYNLQVTRQAGTYTIFVNGTAVSSQPDSHRVPDAKAPLTIGEAESPPGNFFMNGSLDEVAIYDGAVSPTAAAGQPASALSLAPLASSLFSTAVPAVPPASAPVPAAPSAPPASHSGVLLATGTSSTAHSGATDAVFAASHTATNDDDAWLSALLSSDLNAI
jgi:hypothetical protein